MSLPIALYLRKSGGRKSENMRIEHQKELGLKYVNQKDLKYKIFQEVETASKYGRKEFNRMLEEIEEKKLSGIWVWNLNRLDRHVGDFITMRDLITDLHVEEKFDVLVHCNGREYRCWDTNDRQAMGFNAIMNEAAKDFIVQSTTEAKISLLNRGIDINGQVGYGYQRVEIDKVKTIIIKEDEAKWVREIYRIFLLPSTDNYGSVWDRLSKRYKEELDPTITKALIVKILNHKRYTGIRETHFRGNDYSITMEPIIDEETFNKVQDKIEYLKGQRANNSKKDYLLNNIIHCHKCDDLMWVLGGNDTDYKYYSCKTKLKKQRLKRNNYNKWKSKYNNTNGCDVHRNNKIRISAIDEVVWNTLFDIMKQSKYVFSQLRKKYDDQKLKYNDNKAKLNYYKREIDKLKVDMKKAIMLSVKNDLGLDDDLLETYQDKIKHAKKRVSELDSTVSNFDLIKSETKIKDKILTELNELHKDRSFSNMNFWVSKYISKVVVERLENQIKDTKYKIVIYFKIDDEDLSNGISKEFRVNDNSKNRDNLNSILNSIGVEDQNSVSKYCITFDVSLNIIVNYPNNQHKITYLGYKI